MPIQEFVEHAVLLFVVFPIGPLDFQPPSFEGLWVYYRSSKVCAETVRLAVIGVGSRSIGFLKPKQYHLRVLHQEQARGQCRSTSNGSQRTELSGAPILYSKPSCGIAVSILERPEMLSTLFPRVPQCTSIKYDTSKVLFYFLRPLY